MQSDSSKDVLERDKWWRRGERGSGGWCGVRREQFDEPGNGNDDDDEDDEEGSGYAGCLNVMTMLIL